VHFSLSEAVMEAKSASHPVSATYFKAWFAGQMMQATSLGGISFNVAAPTLGM
jgi:hypothetical protein